MSRYRYRTTALTGPWRDIRQEAVRDAVRAKQAMMEDENPDEIKWIVPGRIEEVSNASAPTRARN